MLIIIIIYGEVWKIHSHENDTTYREVTNRLYTKACAPVGCYRVNTPTASSSFHRSSSPVGFRALPPFQSLFPGHTEAVMMLCLEPETLVFPGHGWTTLSQTPDAISLSNLLSLVDKSSVTLRLFCALPCD